MLSSLCCSLRQCAISSIRSPNVLQNVEKMAGMAGVEQKKTIFTLRRKWNVPPVDLRKSGKIQKLKPKYRVYIPEGHIRVKRLLRLILTEDIEGLGTRGDVVIVPKRQGRYELLQHNKAVYASPENIEEFAKADDGKDLPLTMSATLRYLGDKRLEVGIKCLETEPQWEELSHPKKRIIHAFKNNLGVVVTEDAIQLPEEPIKDYGMYTIHLTINGTETLPIEMDLVKEIVT